ncbi:MAG: hypothetical protein JW741_04345 [Sedimentisphaerales bacterium]|nr:hypothetical protein [Sedimentisphaerales bacterium]
MKRYVFGTTLLLVFCLSQAAFASGGLAIAGKAGTLGLGGELMVNVLSDVNCRFGATVLDLDLDGELADIDYDFDMDLQTFPLMLDWYPFDDSFHISAGIIINETDVGLDAELDGSITIGSTEYDAGDIGVLSGEMTVDHTVPYVGIGWGNAFGKNRRWGILTDFGVAFIGSPDVTLTATGPLATDPDFLADLAREEEDLEDDIGDFKVYPVLSASLFFRF